MTIETQGFQFRLTAVENLSISSYTRQFIKKPFVNIIYLKTPPEDSVKVEYVGSKEISPNNNLHIVDYSNSVYSNSKNNTRQEFIGDTNSFSIPISNKNFLITQEFIENTRNDIPLFFRHELSASVDPTSVKIFDKNFEEVSKNYYKIKTIYSYNEDTGVQLDTIESYYVFNSLESSYDDVKNEHSVLFIQYKESSNKIRTELLNNKKAYSKATFKDYWFAQPGTLKSWSYSYLLQNETSFSSGYLISLPRSKKYAVRYVKENRIKINQPSSFSDEDPWFLRITDGGFLHSYNNHSSKYDIREFSSQSFNPIEPYKLAARVKCLKITDNLIKLPNDKIITGSLFSSLDIIIEKNGVALYAITTNEFKEGDPYYNFEGEKVIQSDGTNLQWSYSSLLGFDSFSGFVFTDISLLDSYNIYATYNYEEEYYQFTSLLMNPIFDRNAISEVRALYLIPRNLKNKNSTTQTASLKYVRISKSGKIVDTNQDGRTFNENIKFNTILSDPNGFSLSGIVGLHYCQYNSTLLSSSFNISTDEELSVSSTSGFPKNGWLRCIDSISGKNKYFKYQSKTELSFVLSEDDNVLPASGIFTAGSKIELVNFIDERTTRTRRTSTEEDLYNGEASLPSVYCQYFILGEATINPPHGIHDLTRIDVRENGGGIIESKYEEAKKLNPEVQWVNDSCSFDGQPYPGDSVCVVKLPVSLKEKYSLEQIKAIVKENVTFGVYPLIRFYGYSPRIISIEPGVDSVTVNWEKEGDEFIYNIWYSKQRDGEYQKANITRVIDGIGEYNSYTIENLSSSAYYIKITMEDKYYQWWYGYESAESISGGYGLEINGPTAPFYNKVSIQFNLVT